MSRLISDLLDAVVRDELSDPSVEDVTLTAIELSPDGHHLFVCFVARDRPGALAGLVRAAPLIRARISDRLGVRLIPELHFALDPRAA